MAKNRHKELGLSDQEVLNMYEVMVLARRIDERMWLLNRSGKIPFVISCQGQEAAQVGAAFALDRQQDYILPYYRDLAAVLSFGMTPKEVLLSAFAKAEDPNSGGRQMPGHFGQKKNRIVTGSSPVTTQVPHAVGVALAARMEKKILLLLLRLEKAHQTKVISMKEPISQGFINSLLFSCVKTTNMPFQFRLKNSSLVKKYRIAQLDTACRESQLMAMTLLKCTRLSRKRENGA